MKRSLTVLVWLIVLFLGAVTAAANFRFGFLITAGPERWVYATGGMLLDVTKTLLPTILATFLVGPLTCGLLGRHLAGWGIWSFGVVWSMICALGLYAIAKDARVGDVKSQQAVYAQLVADKPKKEARIGELGTVKAYEIIEGEIAAQKRHRLWERTQGCSDATTKDRRTFCADMEKLTAALTTAPKAAEIAAELATTKDELRRIEVQLAGIKLDEVFKAADPATDALVKLTGQDAETVKVGVAILLALLFEGGGLLGWIVTGSHGQTKPKAPRRSPRTEEKAVSLEQSAPDQTAPDATSLVERWAASAITKRVGSYVLASEARAAFEAWCRLHGHEIPNPTAFGREMTRLGYARIKKSGEQRYVDIVLMPRAATALRVVGGSESPNLR